MPAHAVTLTLEPDGRICLDSRYQKEFVEAFKEAIPFHGREWFPDRKQWLVADVYAMALLQFLHGWGCQVTDGRPQPPAVAPEAVPVAPPPEMPVKLRWAFDVLDLQYGAMLCAAEGVFRAYAKFFHPDKGGDPERFHEINKAIEIIRDALERGILPGDELPADDSDIPF